MGFVGEGCSLCDLELYIFTHILQILVSKICSKMCGCGTWGQGPELGLAVLGNTMIFEDFSNLNDAVIL